MKTHPNGMSISRLVITTKGFKDSQIIDVGEIDPIQKVALADLDRNGFEEVYLFTQIVGSGSGGDFIILPQIKMKN